MTGYWLYAPDQIPKPHPRLGRGPVFPDKFFTDKGYNLADISAANAPGADPDVINHLFVGFWPLDNAPPPAPPEEQGDYERQGFTFTGTLGVDGVARPNWVGPIPWRRNQRLRRDQELVLIRRLPAIVSALESSPLQPGLKSALIDLAKIIESSHLDPETGELP